MMRACGALVEAAHVVVFLFGAWSEESGWLTRAPVAMSWCARGTWEVIGLGWAGVACPVVISKIRRCCRAAIAAIARDPRGVHARAF